MPKFKMPLQKDIIKVGEVPALLASDTFCHIQGPHSTVYALVSMYHGKVSCILIVNCDRTYLFQFTVKEPSLFLSL